MKSLFVLVTTIQLLVPRAVLADPQPGSVPSHRRVPSSGGVLIRNEPCLVTSTEIAEGRNLVQEGRFVEGGAKFASALETLSRAGAPDTSHACLMNSIGFVELKQRRPDIAIEWFQKALAVKPLPGALVARVTGNLADAYYDLDQMNRAEELARRAIELYENTLGPDHPEITFSQITLASVHVARGEYVRAEPVFRRVLYLAERSWGASSYEVATAANNLAYIYMTQAKYSLARELFEKSLAGLENNPVRGKGEIPLTQANLAASCAAGGRHRDAQRWLEAALAQAPRELSPDHDLWPAILERIAIAQFFLKDYEPGRQMFDRALGLIEARYGQGSPQAQDAFERHLTVIRNAKDKTGARMLESRRKAFAPKH